jgi:cathepsin B
MKTYIVLALLALTICINEQEPFFTKEHLDELSAKASFKVASHDEHRFKDWSIAEIKSRLGLIFERKPKTSLYGEVDDSLPKEFDGRTEFKDCIHPIRDQKRCGSCWAFAASEVLSDRFCIATNGKVNTVLSAQDLVSCDTQDYGCQGGYVDKSWDYIRDEGIVTDQCYPYTSGDGIRGKCKSTCQDGGEFKKYKVSDYDQFDTITEAKKSLVEQGPLEAAFIVYDDFPSYAGGVYRRSSNKVLGGHAVKVVGFGVEDNGSEYWIVANSWGNKWGEEGFFKIAFGQCEFENQLTAGTPDVQSLLNHFI